ncbi:YdcP family protein [Carnobacterium gallinarum]|uniref:YdcP family protein n=1 Tax=Carnobacterium gallinarum TaxID=2749 RepID=UPI00054CEDA1|nr:YdcP family protein [Carnobacterium gallinarum]
MELKHIIPNMEKTFGQLEFAGEGKVEQRRLNGKMVVISRSYNLYSTIQRADDIVVILPAESGEKIFEVEDNVQLVNPKITAEGYKIGTRGFTNYVMHADDIIKVEGKK